MKLLTTFVFVLLINSSAQAGPRFFNATINSKVLGSFQTSLKLTELSQTWDAIPQVITSTSRDNGQIVSMDCVTAATFNDVAGLSLQVLDSQGPISNTSKLLDVIVADSYQMKDEAEICEKVSLIDLKKGSLSINSLESTVEVKVKNENYFLSVSVRPFAYQVDVNVSGDENRMSLDWVDLLTSNGNTKREVYFSVYKKSGSSVSYYEHGSAQLNLQ